MQINSWYEQRIDTTFYSNQISQALKEMYPTKVPGPDDIPPLFFQKFWPHIGSFITNVVSHILNTNEVSENVNNTFITLS